MPQSGDTKNLSDEMIVPFKELLVQVARGVAEAQRALDEQSLALQKDIYRDEDLVELRDAGVQATWYQIPEVTAKLKVSVSMHTESETSSKSAGNKPIRLLLAPFNAAYKNSFDYDYEGTSEMAFKIVPIPPPTAATFTEVPALFGKTEEEVKESLGASKLILGDMEFEKSEESPGTVIEQSPEAGAEVQVGESVDIVLAEE